MTLSCLLSCPLALTLASPFLGHDWLPDSHAFHPLHINGSDFTYPCFLLQWMLFLLVILMVQMICQSVPLFRPRMGRGYRMKSVSVTKRLSMQLRSRLSMRPTNQRIIKLCSRNQNVYIQVRPNGVVNGTHDRNSKYSEFYFYFTLIGF